MSLHQAGKTTAFLSRFFPQCPPINHYYLHINISCASVHTRSVRFLLVAEILHHIHPHILRHVSSSEAMEIPDQSLLVLF